MTAANGVGTLTSGDKYFVRFNGTTTIENGAPVSATCTWSFTGGTGKLKGPTGKGTCTGTFDSTGGAVFDVQLRARTTPGCRARTTSVGESSRC